MPIKKNLLPFFFVLLCTRFLYAGTLFNLPNPIGSTAFAERSKLFFVGSAAPSSGDAAAFAVAVAGTGSTFFSGITPGETFIEGSPAANPLHGAQINILANTGRTSYETDGLPIVVIENDPNHVYLINSYVQTSNPSLVISSLLQDTTGNPASSIDALVGSVQGSIFAAVAPQAGAFGTVGGGISLANLVTGPNGDQITFGLPAAVDITSPLVAIGSNLQSLTNPLLYVSSYKTMQEINVGTLFAGFTVLGGSGSNDGALAVISTLDAVGSSFLTLNQIAPASALTSDSIIGAIGADTQITIHFLSTLLPSVGTQYLVVVGGVGSANTDPINVYALPITSAGSLASINAAPQTNILAQRQFVVPAVNQGDLYSSSSIPALVGGGPAPGTITSLYTAGDSVIITVTGSTDQAPGAFYSQAIFNTNSVISGWTTWQRAVYTQGTPEATVYDRVNAQFWYTTALSNTVQSVVVTSWSNPTNTLSELLASSLPQSQGGIQGVLDLIATTSLFSQSPSSASSTTLFTGLNTVVLAQTAQASGMSLTPITLYPHTFASSDGTLNNFTSPAQYISMTGGVLADLGALIAATVVSDGVQSWIVVGGNGGLAILALPSGAGIANGSITQNFTGLSSQLAWQQLGQYSNVRKVIGQNGYLYVLTDTLFERIAVTQNLINKTVPFSSVNLATAQTLTPGLLTAGPLTGGLYFLFSDCVVSDPLAILATSSGLLRSGNGVSISTASSQYDVQWQSVPMPESTGPATRLWTVTPTGSSTDLYNATSRGGNLYVLSSNVSLDQARIYRYVISYASSGIGDSTVQLFNDFFLANRYTFFFNVGYYRNFFYTDGMLGALSRSRYLLQRPFVQTLPAVLTQGYRATAPQNSGFFSDVDANSVGQLQRLSGLGSWVIPGDFGLVVHQ